MINILSYGIQIWTDLSSVLSGITRVTDRRTDGQTDRIILAIPRLHYMQRGKNKATKMHMSNRIQRKEVKTCTYYDTRIYNVKQTHD